MTGVVIYNGSIGVGDLDVFRFTACAADSLAIRMDEDGGGGAFTPQLRLFGRDGTLLNSVSGAAAAQIVRSAPFSGSFLLVAGDLTSSLSGSGNYTLTVNGLSDGFKLCAPVIAEADATVQGVGGQPDAEFILFTHTNVATPASLWSPILTNNFDEFGVFSYERPLNPAEPQRYFLLQQQ